ncbi:MAG: diguanylate cyclase [Lachnospiraceae bacterium]|nr:diguanylate cyclase [Lachnospiraceae bacterium]
MYHCNVCFYFVGERRELLEVLKKAEPLEHFAHDFVTSPEPSELLIKRADVILADLQVENAEALLRILLYYKKEEAQLILLADKEQTQFLMEQDLSAVTDIWPMPLSEEEMRFRFLRWQQTNKMSKDYWQTQNYLDTTINSVPHMIWYKDKTGAHMKVNDFFCKTVNKTMEQIEGRGHYYIWDLTPDDYAKGEFICMESEFEVMDKRETCIFDEDVKISDEMRKLQTYKSPLFDLDGSVMGTVGIALDVTDLLMYQEMLIKNANTDALTGLSNRRYAYEFVDQLEDNYITIFGIDLDNFKSVNDIYGHQEGDHALILTAQVLQECMPENLIVRNGGDEFMVIMLGEHTKEEIEEKRVMIETKLDEAFGKSANLQEISASVGAAYTDKGKGYFDKLVAEADALMYSQKEGKKRR